MEFLSPLFAAWAGMFIGFVIGFWMCWEVKSAPVMEDQPPRQMHRKGIFIKYKITDKNLSDKPITCNQTDIDLVDENFRIQTIRMNHN